MTAWLAALLGAYLLMGLFLAFIYFIDVSEGVYNPSDALRAFALGFGITVAWPSLLLYVALDELRERRRAKRYKEDIER